MMIDLNNTYETRDGQAVKLYAVDIDNTQYGQVIGGVDGTVLTWEIGGSYTVYGTSSLDLIEVKKK